MKACVFNDSHSKIAGININCPPCVLGPSAEGLLLNNRCLLLRVVTNMKCLYCGSMVSGDCNDT